MVDSSALLAIATDESTASICRAKLDGSSRRLISAVNLTEALVVAGRRSFGPGMERLIRGLTFEVVSVGEPEARAAADAYARWGKGVHPARLNLADCFAYALARERGSPLLYVGRDFAQTDVRSALAAADL